MKIRILSIQRHRDVHLAALEQEYLKRLSRHASVTFVTVKGQRMHSDEKADVTLQKEAAALLEKIERRDFVILLDPAGKMFDTPGLASQVKQWQENATGDLSFVIGGPLGVAPSLRERANLMLSLSRITFTHEMARMLLCEALYRSFDILNGGNYHK